MKIFFLLFSSVCLGTPLSPRVRLGFPSMLSAEVSRKTSEEASLSVGFGFLPFWSLYTQNPSVSQTLGDDYRLDLFPAVQVLSPSLSYRFRPWKWDVYLRTELGLLMGFGGGSLQLIRDDTGRRVEVAQIEGILFLPALTVMAEMSIYKSEAYSLFLGAGLTYFPTSWIRVSTLGPGANYVDMVPAARDSVDSAFDQAEAEVSSALQRVASLFQFLPAVAVTATW